MHQKHRVFLGWLPQASALRYIKTECIEEERKRNDLEK